MSDFSYMNDQNGTIRGQCLRMPNRLGEDAQEPPQTALGFTGTGNDQEYMQPYHDGGMKTHG